MKEPKTITIGAGTFTLFPIPPRRAGELERRLLKAVLPALAGGVGGLLRSVDFSSVGDTFSQSSAETGKKLMGAVLGSKIDVTAIANSCTESLGALSDLEFDGLVLGMFERVQWHRPSDQPVFLVNGSLVDSSLESTMEIYKLMFEVARYNKFLPFGMAITGAQT